MVIGEAGIQLHVLLETNCPEADALRDRFHRVSLHRWRMGHTVPHAVTASEIEKLSKGKVKAALWTEKPNRKRVSSRDAKVRRTAR